MVFSHWSENIIPDQCVFPTQEQNSDRTSLAIRHYWNKWKTIRALVAQISPWRLLIQKTTDFGSFKNVICLNNTIIMILLCNVYITMSNILFLAFLILLNIMCMNWRLNVSWTFCAFCNLCPTHVVRLIRTRNTHSQDPCTDNCHEAHVPDDVNPHGWRHVDALESYQYTVVDDRFVATFPFDPCSWCNIHVLWS